MTDTTDTVPSDSISLAGARRVLDAALAHAESMSRDDVHRGVRQRGGSGAERPHGRRARLTAKIAADKAWTVASFNGLPTHDWWPMIEHNPALVHGITQTPRLIVFGGGVAVRVDGHVVGAIGVSGGSSEDDRAVAEAGAAALGP